MKRPIIFTLGFITAILISVSYKAFFQDKIIILENPFSAEKVDPVIEKMAEMETLSTTTSTSTDAQ